ncbi:DUF2304 family protein [Spirosoma koreense]
MKVIAVLTPIQLLLIALLGLLFIVALRVFRNRLYLRVLFMLGLVAAIVFIVYPTLTVYLALLVGVGRGVDLIFYLLFLVIVFALVSMYRRILRLDETITNMIRKEALRDGQKLN